MNLFEKIENYANSNLDKKIAMFIDMDGVIADLDVDVKNNIAKNVPNLFFNKRPLKTTISMLYEVSKISNIDLYILSACGYKNQAADKARWLEKNAPFFEKEKQIYVIKEIVNYTKETKSKIKIGNIALIMKKYNYDLAIYFEDELEMLKAAYNLLNDRIWCIHISQFIE